MRSAPSVSAMKLDSPGVSMRLILRPSCSNEATLAPIDIWRSCSSSSKSPTVVPSSTRPRRLTIPASKSSASASRGLTAPAVADQRDVANPVGRPRSHVGNI